MHGVLLTTPYPLNKIRLGQIDPCQSYHICVSMSVFLSSNIYWVSMALINLRNGWCVCICVRACTQISRLLHCHIWQNNFMSLFNDKIFWKGDSINLNICLYYIALHLELFIHKCQVFHSNGLMYNGLDNVFLHCSFWQY